MQMSDGMNYAPTGKPNKVVKPGEFRFAAMHLDHGHIYGMCNGLMEAGAELKYVYEPNDVAAERFQSTYPTVKRVRDPDEILEDPEIKLVAAAAITSERCSAGLRIMDAGKDYFTDKAPLTTLEQLELARKKTSTTKRKYMCYFSERLHVEGAVYAGQLIKSGAIGKVIHVMGVGPHRLSKNSRPDWFFQHKKYGGILCDIGSHQIEQYLYFADVKDAQISYSQVANYANPEHPELEDFGDAMLVGDNGATNYFRVDWFTPDGLRTWGDGRCMIVGTEGYIEIRKYINVAEEATCDHVFLVDKTGEHHFRVNGQVGFPFFGELVLDCLNRTEKSMTQEHVFKAAELAVRAQMQAVRVT